MKEGIVLPTSYPSLTTIFWIMSNPTVASIELIFAFIQSVVILATRSVVS
jgi:hypothetical protein